VTPFSHAKFKKSLAGSSWVHGDVFLEKSEKIVSEGQYATKIASSCSLFYLV
jgi:hypothetical protein